MQKSADGWPEALGKVIFPKLTNQDRLLHGKILFIAKKQRSSQSSPRSAKLSFLRGYLLTKHGIGSSPIKQFIDRALSCFDAARFKISSHFLKNAGRVFLVRIHINPRDQIV